MALMKPSLPEGTPCFGVLAQFRDPAALTRACQAVRDAGFTKWDAHSPFPVHGLDGAMGLKRSILPGIIFVAAMLGAVGALALQGWTSAVDYPLVISGKPLFSWQAFVPIIFELAVLCGALAAVFGMLGLNQLPTLYHPLFASRAFERASDDGFFISIEAWDPKFDVERNAAFLRELGATHVEVVAH
ncbi:MAG TPA: DUF3341 domain-containing protein [Candidatus Polarisedimenticolaceae bacterium]|nr:DUF3341 domain-containing protein [Candidatus Polarisedimenticolaceae bacterium]